MKSKSLAVACWFAIAALVAGGMAWTTSAALQLEHADSVRLALWRLDSRVFPVLAREDSRPVSHYEPVYPPVPALDAQGRPVSFGSVLVTSPLLSAELPEWVSIHFVIDAAMGWRSPQAMNPALARRLQASPAGIGTPNATPARSMLLKSLAALYPVGDWFPGGKDVKQTGERAAQTEDAAAQTSNRSQSQAGQWLENEAQKRSLQQSAIRGESRNYEGNNSVVLNIAPITDLIGLKSMPLQDAFTCSQAVIHPMKPEWRVGRDGAARLMLLRSVAADNLSFYQGVLFDWPKLKEVLLEEVRDLLPNADLIADDGTHADHMTALPVRLDAPGPGWWPFPVTSPLRWGLLLAWLAVALALGVVAFGGWTLLDLSERRFRFVTAVTHELRTPLTTLRLYLDMLTGGMVRDENRRSEYLRTLRNESDRLHRLITNVLDFARLERQKPVVNLRPVNPAEFVASIDKEWRPRCASEGKNLVVRVEPDLPESFTTDPDLLRQLLGNLLDNACKYSRHAEDATVTLGVAPSGRGVVVTVEDRGPGIPSGELGVVFRAFRRGRETPADAGGVGLGLTLARRWAALLGGELTVHDAGPGARFEFRSADASTNA